MMSYECIHYNGRIYCGNTRVMLGTKQIQIGKNEWLVLPLTPAQKRHIAETFGGDPYSYLEGTGFEYVPEPMITAAGSNENNQQSKVGSESAKSVSTSPTVNSLSKPLNIYIIIGIIALAFLLLVI